MIIQLEQTLATYSLRFTSPSSVPSAGDMGGLAAGMIILGIIMGFGGMYLYGSRQWVPAWRLLRERQEEEEEEDEEEEEEDEEEEEEDEDLTRKLYIFSTFTSFLRHDS